MKIGIALIPGTFPTYIIHRAIYDNLPISGGEWTREKINNLYYLYKDAIESGVPVYQEGQTQAVEWIKQNSNYDLSDIRVFLYVLYTLAKAGEINQKWWNIPLQEKRNVLPDIPGTKSIEKTLNNVTGAVKWGSIALLGGITVYFLWPFLKKIRS